MSPLVNVLFLRRSRRKQFVKPAIMCSMIIVLFPLYQGPVGKCVSLSKHMLSVSFLFILSLVFVSVSAFAFVHVYVALCLHPGFLLFSTPTYLSL